MLKINFEGTRNVLAACHQHGVQRMIHIGALASAGEPDDPSITRVDEATPTHPRADESAYTYSKRLANEAVQEAAAQGLSVVSI